MTPLLGPGWGNYALRGIVEIEVPAPVSLLPQTPGWWVVLGVALGALLRFAWRRLRRWQQNRYRRVALQTLTELESRFGAGDDSALLELAPLLRATALEASSRASIAGARGEDWARELSTLAPGLPPLPVDDLQLLAYAPRGIPADQDVSSIFEQLRLWIQRHDNCHA